MALVRSLLELRPFSTTTTTAVAAASAADSATINSICRILSDHRSPHHDLESALLPFVPLLTPPLLDHLLRRLHHLPLPSHRLFLLASSLPSFTPSLLSHLTLLHSLSTHRLFPLCWAHLSDHKSSLFPSPSSSSSSSSAHPFHILFFAYSKSNLPDLALRAFLRIPDFNLAPTVADLDLLLYALCHHGHVLHAQDFFHRAKSDFAVTRKTYTILIAKSKDAVSLFDEMRHRENCCPVDVVAYNALLAALCRGGEVDEAQRRLKEMRGVYGLEPDAATYSVFIRAYCEAKDVHSAMRMVENARRKGLVPNVFTFNCVIKLLCEMEKVDEAYELLDEMIERGAKPDAWSYNRIMAVHCKLHEVNKALRLLKRMDGDGCLPDRHTYNMLMKMLIGVGRMDRAMEVWDGMEGRGFYPAACSYAVMIHGLCKKKGGVEEACRYFEVMVDEGIPPYDSTCMLLRGELLRLGLKEKVYVLTDKMRRSTSCTIHELASVMERGKKLDKEEEAVNCSKISGAS